MVMGCGAELAKLGAGPTLERNEQWKSSLHFPSSAGTRTASENGCRTGARPSQHSANTATQARHFAASLLGSCALLVK